MRGAAHVFLHQFHAAGGFQVEPACVKANAFSHQRYLGRIGIAPQDVDEPGRIVARPADGVNRRIILLQQIVSDDLGEGGAMLVRHLPGRRREFGRPHVLRRRVDQVADQVGTLRRDFDAPAIGALRPNQPRIRPIDILVAAERICAERPAEERDIEVLRIGPLDCIGPAGQSIRQFRQCPDAETVVADTNENLGERAGGIRDRAAGPLFGFEPQFFDPIADMSGPGADKPGQAVGRNETDRCGVFRAVDEAIK